MCTYVCTHAKRGMADAWVFSCAWVRWMEIVDNLHPHTHALTFMVWQTFGGSIGYSIQVTNRICRVIGHFHGAPIGQSNVCIPFCLFVFVCFHPKIPHCSGEITKLYDELCEMEIKQNSLWTQSWRVHTRILRRRSRMPVPGMQIKWLFVRPILRKCRLQKAGRQKQRQNVPRFPSPKKRTMTTSDGVMYVEKYIIHSYLVSFCIGQNLL